MFEEQSREKSQSIALRCGDQELLYGELEQRAARLAHRLQTMGAGPNVPVALCLNRSVEMVVGILAVLKAGGAYVLLDPSNPRTRLELILEDCQPKVLLAQSNSLGMALSAEIPTVFMDRDLSEVNDA